MRTALIGEYNVSNLLAVIGGLRALGVPLAEARPRGLCAVPERRAGAHAARRARRAPAPRWWSTTPTPDALEKALIALRPLATQRGGRLWCVFGCGGNRDTAKRPLMGAIAQRLPTASCHQRQPRHEAPQAILAQILRRLSRAAMRCR